jgi:subtilisin family serine protease
MRVVRQALCLGVVFTLVGCGGEVVSQEAEALGQSQAPLMKAEPGRGVPGAYLVGVKEGVDARSVAAVAGVKPTYVYTVVNGFAATLNEGQLSALRANPGVEYVEEDQVLEPNTTQSSAPWGLDRIDQRALPLSGTYNYTTTASNVSAYIIDTGIATSHTGFGMRATNVYDAFGGNGQDCNGHGTYVAGIVGSSTYGVAKGVRLRGVKVVDCNGSGTTSGIVGGVDWVRLNHIKPAVANMSLGGGYSSTLNTAVTNLSNAGVFVSVAAGNSSSDACNYSPASAVSATTVGAMGSNDCPLSSSNFGSCVDLYAPGANITSLWLNGGTNTLSGTSPAAAHVNGVAALYKATYGDAASSTVDAWLKTNASTVTCGTSSYKLLYNSAL